MSKLFIIGNGFDRAHGLATSYDEFRRYLCDTYINGECVDTYIPIVPSVIVGPKGEEVCNMKEVAEFLVYIISIAEPDGNKWSDLETSLGRLDYNEAFYMLPEDLDEDGDINFGHKVYNNEDMASNLHKVISHVKDLFAEWVNRIDIGNAIPKQSFISLIKGEDVFLTFNYTQTLEELYGVKKESVCHIHGKQGEEILFGHGNKENRTEEYMRKNIGSENELSELDNFLRKDTEYALNKHRKFFTKINDMITEVYSIGFSFADVDMVYMREVCRKLSSNTIWYLNDYNSSDIPIFKAKLRECGFKGKFKKFKV